MLHYVALLTQLIPFDPCAETLRTKLVGAVIGNKILGAVGDTEDI